MGTGDQVAVQRGGYLHHGVDLGDGTVTHCTGAVFRRTSRWVFARGNVVSVVARPTNGLTASDVVARAQAMIGIEGYGLTRRNCEHYAAWAVTGRSASRQVEEFALQARAALRRSVTAVDPTPFVGWAVWEFGGRLARLVRERFRATAFRREYAAGWAADSWTDASGRPCAMLRDLQWIAATPRGPVPVDRLQPGAVINFRLWTDPLGTVFASAPHGSLQLVGGAGTCEIAPGEQPPTGLAPAAITLRRPAAFAAIERTRYRPSPSWLWPE